MPLDRRDLRRRLFTLIAEQGGYFTAAQAKEIGYSYQSQAHHVAAGNWMRVDRGLFRLVEWVPGVHDDLARWTLWSRGRGVVSHESALSVHEIGEFEAARVHLTVPPDFSIRDDAVVIHRAELPDADVTARLGFRVTTPIRSIVDIAALAPDEDQLARAIEDAQQGGLLTIRGLRARAESLDPRAALYIERAIQRMEVP
jgi:predicted transcriptional regulator of viral defense system